MEKLHQFRSWRKLRREAENVHATALAGDEFTEFTRKFMPVGDQCLGTAMIHISKSTEISAISTRPLSKFVAWKESNYLWSQCHQETTRHLPGAVGFPGTVGKTRQIKRVFKQCLNLLTELNVLNISNTRMQKSSVYIYIINYSAWRFPKSTRKRKRKRGKVTQWPARRKKTTRHPEDTACPFPIVKKNMSFCGYRRWKTHRACVAWTPRTGSSSIATTSTSGSRRHAFRRDCCFVRLVFQSSSGNMLNLKSILKL